MQIDFPNIEGSGEIHLDVLKAICGDTKGKSMIDLGAGFAPQTRQLGFDKTTYVDLIWRDLEEESENLIQEDIFIFFDSYSSVTYDVSLSLDNIEHFVKREGRRLLELMETFSHKQIIFTPIGEYMIESKPSLDPDTHKSGWFPEELEDLGYSTIVFPKYHPTLGIGAFFAFKSKESDDIRIEKEIKSKSWAK